MSTQAIDYTNETFRLRRSIQLQGIVYTMLYLAVAIASVSVAFVDEPARYGFNGEHAIAFSVVIGIVFWGGWTLLGVYTLVAYYVERVTVAGTSVTVRSVFRNRQFDTSEVVKLTWNARTMAGRLDFRTSNRRIKLDLYGFRDEDRVRLIRLFRCLIPEDKQIEWPMFCHKVALPLRDRRLAPKLNDPALVAASGDVIVTRKRYDRLAVVLVPVAIIIAFLAWWITTSPVVFVIPACLTFFWLCMRFSVRPEGELQPRLSGRQGGRTMLFGMTVIVISGMVAAALRLSGFSRDAGCTAGLLIAGPALLIFIYGLHRADKQHKREAEDSAIVAPQSWNQGEPSIHGLAE